MARNYFFIFLFFNTINFNVYSQSFEIYRNDTINRTNQLGLRYGRSVNFYNSKISAEGNYKIISRKDLIKEVDSVKTKWNNNLYSIITQDKKYFYFSNHKDNLFSVPDGYWINYGENWLTKRHEIRKISFFENGYKISQRIIGGNLEIADKEEKTIIEPDSTEVYEDYLGYDKFITKRVNYTKSGDKEVLCYPNQAISLSECEFSIKAIFAKTKTVDFQIKSNVDSIVKISRVEIENKDFSILDENNQKNDSLILKPYETKKLKLVFTPDRYNPKYVVQAINHSQRRDRNTYFLENHGEIITFHTRQVAYNIYVKVITYDLAGLKLREGTILKYKKNTNLPLILFLHPISNHNYYFLYDQKPKEELIKANSDEYIEKDYKIYKPVSKPVKFSYWDDVGGNGLMDLSDLEKGRYYLMVNRKFINIIEIE